MYILCRTFDGNFISRSAVLYWPIFVLIFLRALGAGAGEGVKPRYTMLVHDIYVGLSHGISKSNEIRMLTKLYRAGKWLVN